MKFNVRKCLVLFLLVAFFACAGSSPSGAVRSFYRSLEQGEIEEAMQQLSSSMLAAVGPDKLRAALQQVTREIDRKGGIDRLEIRDEKIIGEVAELTVVVEYGNGSTETEKVKLVKEEGEWRIQMDK